jgi:hypothetical protein
MENIKNKTRGVGRNILRLLIIAEKRTRKILRNGALVRSDLRTASAKEHLDGEHTCKGSDARERDGPAASFFMA